MKLLKHQEQTLDELKEFESVAIYHPMGSG
jgi:hypothetical protein